eukprot:XP_019923299.1 PREDICTED: uncharacterized protein LOC109618898 [Crassostrea gigas]
MKYEWWMSFMAFISFTYIPVVRAIQMLHFYLTGISLQWFTFLNPVKKTSLEMFKQAFFDRFKPSSPINKDLLRIQQQPREGVEEYFYRVRKLATNSTMDELAVTELAKDGLHQRLRELVVPQRPTTLDQLREQAILAVDAVDMKRSTSNQIPSADSLTKGTVDTALVAAIQAAMMNIMPATVSQHRQDEEVNAVYSPCLTISGPAAIDGPDEEVPACHVVASPVLIRLTVLVLILNVHFVEMLVI